MDTMMEESFPHMTVSPMAEVKRFESTFRQLPPRPRRQAIIIIMIIVIITHVKRLKSVLGHRKSRKDEMETMMEESFLVHRSSLGGKG
jgi:hypothetical protein